MYNHNLNFYPSGSPVSCLLILSMVATSIAALYKQSFFLNTILHPTSIFKGKQYYRLVTSDFVHNDVVHLLFNVIAIFLFCTRLEVYLNSRSPFGSWEFLFIYLVSALTGSIFTSIRHRNDFEFSGAGSSGSILGCLMSFMMLQPDKIALYFPGIGGVKNSIMVLLYIIALIYFQWKTKNKMLNHEIHFFGAVGGILGTVILFPQIFK